MKKVLNYDNECYIGSISFSIETDQYLINNNLNPIRINDGYLTIVNKNALYECNDELINYVDSLNELDVVEIDDNGVFHHLVNQGSDDATLFITEKCNSNCIMCPYSESIRRNGIIPSDDYLLQVAKHFPLNLRHITITGGEPFMIKHTLFDILNIFKERYYEQEILLLTNGRIFCLDDYVNKLKDASPKLLMLGIPVHGYNSETHDLISQTPNSFKQTSSGISKLLNMHFNIELRIVVSKMNYQYLDKISTYISESFPNVFRVVFIGMEMLGNAVINKNSVWISYRESAPHIEKAVDILVKNGITTKIYNYPLCVINKKYWSVVAKSISDYKVQYTQTCESCKVKTICGGLFNSTLNLENEELTPIGDF